MVSGYRETRGNKACRRRGRTLSRQMPRNEAALNQRSNYQRQLNACSSVNRLGARQGASAWRLIKS